mmetsp:Transcript_83486/g.150622  ORF Transcript_83486/g.150622 Transcript_83486/m.150622 type:complete len:371 (-) Transcript_83486:113-1225(-)|eukprot:CAMPEP_0115059002 /NCGR_PEP_ID=MMETSP0227-20121206/6667_1 /TAXON_ID=89957 /ORGANISM="Polarella glacialis, Strain CCMP 1383" /LENGTH=370 /DNA_ID=CAMNT_0002444059 /DNA_START=22 /DNA_END=1134 /DNA_ORIENTATION=+
MVLCKLPLLAVGAETVTRERERAGRLWELKVACSVAVFCLSVSAIPIYNKLVFSRGVQEEEGGLRRYPFPAATAFLQLSLISVVLCIVNIGGHFSSKRDSSWLFGPHFWYKVRHVAPVGLLFGLKYGVTNWGLQLVPVGIHLLLQSTDVLWTVLTARVLNQEHLGRLECAAAVLSGMGSVMIGLHAVQTLEAPLVPLLVNMATPVMLALCVSTLRMGTVELFREDNRLGGTVTATEFTAIKLGFSSLTALILAMLLESGTVEGGGPSWWEALMQEPAEGWMLLQMGGIFVLIFQVNLTWLAGLTSATTVGIVGGLKVVPQWLLNALFQFHLDLSPLNVGGAALVLGASTAYAAACSSSFKRNPGGEAMLA